MQNDIKKGVGDSSGIRIDWLTGLGDIESLKDQWRELESEVRNRTVFSCFDYVIPWYQHYGGVGDERYGEPLLGTAWNGDKLVGIAPFTLWKGHLGRTPVRRIDFVGFTSYAGEFLVRDNEPETVECFMNALLDRGGFDVISLIGFEKESEKYDVICGVLSGRGLKWKQSGYRYARVDLRGGYEAYYTSLNSKVRNSMKRREKKIANAGEWKIDSIRSVHGTEAVSKGLERIQAIYNNSWKAREGETLAEHHVEFYEEIAERFAKRGMIDLSILRIKGKDAAFIFCLVEGGACYDVTVSYDDAYSHLFPGIFLMQELLKRLAARNIHTVVSHGDYEYKKNWARNFVPQQNIYIFSNGFKAHLSRFIKFSVQPMVNTLKQKIEHAISSKRIKTT